MRVLILFARFGQGHMSAAEAVREQVLMGAPDAQAEIMDLVQVLFPGAARLIYGAFSMGVRHLPGIYNRLNDCRAARGEAPLEGLAQRRIDRLMRQKQPTMVICTFPACARYVSRWIERTGSSLTLWSCLTDLTVRREWVTPMTGRYFVGADQTRRALMRFGVAPGHITVSGIPVRAAFYAVHHRPEPGQLHLLVAGGGLGLIPNCEAILEELRCDARLQVTVVTGRDHRLYRRLKEQFPEMEILGYVKEMAACFGKADLILTKAGGITTFEAIASRTPLLVPRPFLTQEEGNAQFVQQNGLGFVFDSPKAAAEIIERCLNSPEELRAIRLRMERLSLRQRSITASRMEAVGPQVEDHVG